MSLGEATYHVEVDVINDLVSNSAVVLQHVIIRRARSGGQFLDDGLYCEWVSMDGKEAPFVDHVAVVIARIPESR